MRRQAPNTWVSQRRSDTLFRDPGALAGKVLCTFTRPALLSRSIAYPFEDLLLIHGRFEHQPKLVVLQNFYKSTGAKNQSTLILLVIELRASRRWFVSSENHS